MSHVFHIVLEKDGRYVFTAQVSTKGGTFRWCAYKFDTVHAAVDAIVRFALHDRTDGWEEGIDTTTYLEACMLGADNVLHSYVIKSACERIMRGAFDALLDIERTGQGATIWSICMDNAHHSNRQYMEALLYHTLCCKLQEIYRSVEG